MADPQKYLFLTNLYKFNPCLPSFEFFGCNIRARMSKISVYLNI